MMFPYYYQNMMSWTTAAWFMPLISVLALWDLVWKGIALWKAGRNNQLIWFIALLLVNSVGILPIIYIVWFQKNQDAEVVPEAKPKRKAKR